MLQPIAMQTKLDYLIFRTEKTTLNLYKTETKEKLFKLNGSHASSSVTSKIMLCNLIPRPKEKFL